MNTTGIAWTVISGCKKITPACAHCYAHDLAERHRGDRRTWSDRVARQPYLAAGSQRCGVCGELGHNARRHRGESSVIGGSSKVEVDGGNVEA